MRLTIPSLPASARCSPCPAWGASTQPAPPLPGSLPCPAGAGGGRGRADPVLEWGARDGRAGGVARHWRPLLAALCHRAARGARTAWPARLFLWGRGPACLPPSPVGVWVGWAGAAGAGGISAGGCGGLGGGLMGVQGAILRWPQASGWRREQPHSVAFGSGWRERGGESQQGLLPPGPGGRQHRETPQRVRVYSVQLQCMKRNVPTPPSCPRPRHLVR